MSQRKRRQLLLAAGALLAARRGAAQQPGRHYRVAVIAPFGAPEGEQYLLALRERLAAHGFVAGVNLTLEPRAAGTDRSLARDLVVDLSRSKLDAIFSITTILTLGAQEATKSVPIIFSWVADPVLSGIVKEYHRPGGNTTGVTNRNFELLIKRLELTRELFPAAKEVAVLAGYFDATLQTAMRLAQPEADRLGLKLMRREAGLHGWARALADAAASGADVVFIVTPFSWFGMNAQAQETVRTALDKRIRVVYSDRDSVELGGLISYATNPTEDVRRGADYLVRVLRGESPASLPVDQASRFELALNLKTAKALGLRIPQSVLARADRLVE
jgi:putative tryptophan/tyrosine transport system substrate-binding protein